MSTVLHHLSRNIDTELDEFCEFFFLWLLSHKKQVPILVS